MDPLAPYYPMAIVFLLAAVLGVIVAFISAVVGPRRLSAVKLDSFEAGSESSGPAQGRFAVKFYVVALLFIVFDLETIFLIPWAVSFGNVLNGADRAMKLLFYGQMMAFIAVLFVGLVYIWKKGGLDWSAAPPDLRIEEDEEAAPVAVEEGYAGAR